MESSTIHDPQRYITLLKGEEDWYSARKVYQKSSDGSIRKIADFKLGKNFLWKQYFLNPGKELDDLQSLFIKTEHDKRIFRIYGQPREDLRAVKTLERNSDNFPEPPGGVQLLEVDVDGWDTSHQWTWGDTEAITQAIHAALVLRGLDFLTRHRCLLMWSQGAVGQDILKCHLYFWMEKPLELELLRDWTRFFNAKQQAKVLDGSVYRAVQPDYIALRRIEYEDGSDAEIIPQKRRHLLLEAFVTDEPVPGIADTIRGMVEHIRGEIDGGAVEVPAGVVLESDGWATLAKAGTGGEVNEYAYRAAAQIVQKAGKKRVMSSLGALAAHMHKILWENVDINSQGVRGTVEDRDTYNIRRMTQYLRSACDAHIGDTCDALVGTVETAIKEFSVNPERLFEADVLLAGNALKNRYPGSFAMVKQLFKSSKLPVSVTDWSKRLDKVIRPRPDMDPLLEGDGVDGAAESLFAGGEFNEHLFREAIISSFRFFRSPEGEVFYVDKADLITRRDGGYFGRDALRFLRSDISVRALALAKGQFTFPDNVFGRVVDSIFVGVDRGEGGVVETGRRMANRVSGSPRGVTWINVGQGSDGIYRCLRVDRGGIQSMTWQESLEHLDAPVWRFDCREEIPFVHNGEHDWTVEGLLAVMHGKGFRKEKWAKALFKLLRVEGPEDEMAVMGFLVNELMGADSGQLLQVIGEQGSGKSMSADILCELVNPAMSSLRDPSPHRMAAYRIQSSTFLQGLMGRNIAVLDNVSGFTGAQQDLLCSVCTGLSDDRRILYSNTWVKSIIRCSLVVACIEGVITRPDLHDRASTVRVRPVTRRDKFSTLVEDGRWPEVRREVFQGLIEMSSAAKAVLAFADSGELDLAHLDISHVGVSGRNLVRDIVRRLYAGEEYPQLKAMANANRAQALIEDDLFSGGFCAWMCEQKDIITDERNMPASDVYLSFKEWVHANLGRKKVWFTPRGEKITLDIALHVGDKRMVPTTPQRFGMKLSRYKNDIEEITGIKIGRSRTHNNTASYFFSLNDAQINDEFDLSV